MKHLDESQILAIRDGGGVGQAEREHLMGCAACATALEEARHRAESIEHALTALDKPVEATAAKAGVRARLAEGSRPRTSRRWSGWHLGRAAALLLVTAGAAAALPGSPLRSLLLPLTGEPSPAMESEVPSPSGATDQEPEASSLTDAGIAVAVPDGTVEVIVRGADPGTEIAVEWADWATARVSAPPGSRFTYSAGRIELDASRGTIHVALPIDAGEVVLEVDGVLYLRGSPGALEVTGPAVERSGDAIRFQVDPL